MKADLHPKYVNATISCVCGNEIKTRSTQKTIKVEICSSCHPFFTGKQKLVDTAGRIDRFRRKYAHLEAKKGGGAEAATPEASTEATPEATTEAVTETAEATETTSES